MVLTRSVKISSKASYSETKKGRKFFFYTTLLHNLISIAITHQDIPYGNLFYGRHNVSQKFKPREVTQKVRRESGQYGYLVIACIRIV